MPSLSVHWHVQYYDPDERRFEDRRSRDHSSEGVAIDELMDCRERWPETAFRLVRREMIETVVDPHTPASPDNPHDRREQWTNVNGI